MPSVSGCGGSASIISVGPVASCFVFAYEQGLSFTARERKLDHDRRSVSGLAVEGEATTERFDAVGHAYEPRRARGLGAADPVVCDLRAYDFGRVPLVRRLGRFDPVDSDHDRRCL